MAYTYSQVDYLLLAAQACTGTGDKGGWTPGYVPHLIRNASFVVGTAETTTNTVLNFTTQGTAYSNSGITAGDVAVLKVLTTHAVGTVVIKDQIPEKIIKPGQRVVFNVGTAGSSLVGDVHIFAEASWETPANNTSMVATT